MFLGDQSVGKTSIITRFMYDKFDNTYQVSTVLVQVQPTLAAPACLFCSCHVVSGSQFLTFISEHASCSVASAAGDHWH